MAVETLRIILIKPSKYGVDGFVERFRWGFMPNSTLAHMKSLTPPNVEGVRCEVAAFDEYVQTDLGYLSALRKQEGCKTLLALVGVQSHQFHRALDLAARAHERGVEHCIIGGSHPMTCDTSLLHNRGISFSLAEAESVWPAILRDAVSGKLSPTYGRDQRWQEILDPPVLQPLPKRDMRRYALPMLGIYPSRGCPYTCNFCSVIKISGRYVRSQPVETTIASLRAAKAGGVRMVLFTSDNFNKYPQAVELLEAMVADKIRLPFLVQCDTQIYKQPELVALMARAGCFQMFVGVESFSRSTLRAVQKFQNQPDHYAEIVALCRSYGITTHFSNILGFPGDTESSILNHLRILRSLEPDFASFYILTPIPGTQQYDEFLEQDLIFEQNLDRFDGTRLTWRHPHLPAAGLHDLLMRCYREFYPLATVPLKFARMSWDFRTPVWLLAVLGYSIASRVTIHRNEHPMAGGIFRIALDSESEYIESRRSIFSIDRLPLPRSLQLSPADQALNQRARLAV